MKNLLIYMRDDGRFSTENKMLARIQIENSLDLGWEPEDILLYTNFPYEHMGVKSRIIPNLCYKEDRTNKIPTIVYLFANDLIGDDLYWYHDFDAFQDGPLSPELKGKPLGLTGYGYKPQWNCGSFFFTKDADATFFFWNRSITPRKRADEKALTDLTNSGLIKPTQYTDVGLEYNYGQRSHEWDFDGAPRVLHFHPYYRYYRAKHNNLDIFMYGKNRFNHPLMSKRLIDIFQRNDVK